LGLLLHGESFIMKNENLVILVGNLTRDPELRYVGTSGKSTAVVNFRLAVSDEYKTANGEFNKITTYVNCEAWDSAAERINNVLHKGDPVFIRGSLRMDEWEKDGKKQTSLKIRVNSFTPILRTSSPRPEPVGASSSVDSEPLDDNHPF
jgi:single-strand DNA-binding protein